MRAYVLVNPKNSRLVDEKIPTYPSCLPDYDVVYGYTLEDNLEVPDWYREHRGCKDNEKRKRGYCAYLGHMHSIIKHYKKYPDEDLLIMEDDVEFIPEFNMYYHSFMKMVPDDWDAIYFGGWYKKGIPTEISPNVLKVNTTCRLYGVECTLLRSKLIKRIVDFFNGDDHSPGLQLDGTLADWAQQDKIKTYTPIVHFAHQKVCFSAVANKIIDRNYAKNTVTNYVSINGMDKVSTNDDLLRYRTEPAKVYAAVLTNKVNNRLVNNEIPNYPTCLPPYKVIYGPTTEDGLAAPDRFIGVNAPLDASIKNNLFCCFSGFVKVLREHIVEHPDDILLFMEDDVTFEPNFNEYYFNFMRMVPDDWDIINFGGCDVSEATEVKSGVLSSTAMAGTECCLMKPSIINAIIDYYDTCANGMPAYDIYINDLVSSGKYKRYIPLYSFTLQKPGYSMTSNRVNDGTLFRRTFKYKDINGNIVSNSSADLNKYTYRLFDNDVKVYVYSSNLDTPNIPNYPDIFTCPKPFSSNLVLLLKEHLSRYPTSDALIFDSKIVFNNLFKYMYSAFISHVPNDCGIIFFGGKYDALSTKINDLVLKPNSIDNNDCFMILAKYIPKLISFLESNDSNFLNSNVSLNELDIQAYTPIIRFASSINSNYVITNKPISINVSNPLPYECKYINEYGDIINASYSDTVSYLKDYMPKALIYVPIYGGLGNALFMVCIARWFRSFGINVASVNKTMWGQQTIDFITNIVKEPMHDVVFKPYYGRAPDKYKELYDSLIVGQHWYLDFYPELRHFVDLGTINIKPIIGINIRRGDFLTHPYKSCNLAFCDLCEKRYYHNAAKIAKNLGLPVRIISDELDKIPKEIIDLFDNPELMHGTFKEDFYNLAECKYKFISNSTFSYWAAYAAPDATVFYPKGCRDDIKLDEWTPLELTDMSDEELEKITPKEEKSE